MDLHDNQTPPPMKYAVRSGTIDQGKDYEVKVAALLCLKCCGKNTRDMWTVMNIDECGAFDDIVLFRESDSGKKIIYLIQLKHQEKSKDIIDKQFFADKGDFALKKYFSSFLQLSKIVSGNNQIIDQYRQIQEKAFIIFTNKGVVPGCKLLQNVDGNPDLNIIKTKGMIYKFNKANLQPQIQLSEDFVDNLYLFTQQSSIGDIDKQIEAAIEEFTRPVESSKHNVPKLAGKFVRFINEWSKGSIGGHFALTKTHVLKILTQLICEPNIHAFDFEKQNQLFEANIWKKIVSNSRITIVDGDNEVISFLYGYVRDVLSEFCEKYTSSGSFNRFKQIMLRNVTYFKKIGYSEAYEYLWKTGKIPLLLEVHNEDEFCNIMHSAQFSQDSFRIIILNNSSKQLPYKNFQNYVATLEDLNQEHQQDILKCPVTIQGRKFIKLLDFVSEDYFKYISVKDIIFILSGRFNIGNTYEPLPEFFIDRSIETVWLDAAALRYETEKFVVLYNSLLDVDTFLRNHDLHSCNNYRFGQPEEFENCIEFLFEPKVVIFDKQNETEQQMETVHYLILHDVDHLQWIKSVGSVENLRQFRKYLKLEEGEGGKVNETFLDFSHNRTVLSRLISANPGMGKTVLINYLALRASTHVWVLKVNLFEHVNYYKRQDFETLHCDPSKHLIYFAEKKLCEENLAKVVFKKYLQSKNVLVLFDGFDEIPVRYQKEASELIKCIWLEGYFVYLTTRPILKTHLEALLDTLAVTLHPFCKNDQLVFLQKYFTSNCEDGHNRQQNIEVFVNNLLNFAKINFSSQDQEFTGVPLQTRLLAEVFTKDCNKFLQSGYFVTKDFDLLYLYGHFIQQKNEICCRRYGDCFLDMLEMFKICQSFYALKLLFAPHDLKGLDVDENLQQKIKNLPNFIQNLQKDGIIVADNESNVTFVHRSFAEYLAAKWLADNIRNENMIVVKTLVSRTFDPIFTPIRNIFDRILAMNLPLHRAIISRQVSKAEKIILEDPNALTKTDKCNRSCFHLIGSWGVHHPATTSDRDINILKQKVATDSAVQILNLIPNNKLECNKDILDYTPVDYAIASGSLNAADAFCAKLQNVNNVIFITNKNLDYIFMYLREFPYGSLGSILIKFYISAEVSKPIYSEELIKSVQSDLPLAVISGDVLKVSLLLSTTVDINKADDSGCTSLHIAAMFGHTLIVQLLLSNEADVNMKDHSGKTSLHWASIKGHANVVSLLLSSHRIHIDATDNNGMSALHYAMVVHNKEQLRIASTLIKSQSNVTLQDNYGNTPLHYTLHYNEKEILTLILKYAANICISDSYSASTSAETNNGYLSEILTSRDFGGGTVLHWAADKGLKDIANLFLSYGIEVDLKDEDGRTPLHWAAERGHVEVIELLLSYRADINVKDAIGRTALRWAVANGHIKATTSLLNRGADVSTKDNEGRTLLHVAAVIGVTDLIKILLYNLPDLDATDEDDMTSVHLASWNGHVETVELLLSEEANLELKDKYGRTPLICSAHNGHKSTVNFLLYKGSDIEAKSEEGMSSLHWAACNGHLETVELLLSKGANLELNDKYGRTPLILSTHNGHKSTANFLLSKGSDIDAKSKEGLSSLHWAAGKGHLDTVELLLAKGANLELKAKNGDTALICSTHNGHKSTSNLLLSKGSDIEAKSEEGMSSLHWAAWDGHLDTVELLLSKGANLELKDKYGRTPLICSARNGHKSTANLLLSKGSDLEAKSKEGLSSLHWAAGKGHFDTVELLLAKGANLELKDKDGDTALICSARNGHKSTSNLLLSKGSDIEAKSEEGMSSLHWAAWNGHLETVELLLSKGADLEVKNKYGKTALICSARNGHKSTANLLLSKGSDIEANTQEGMSSLHWAAGKGHLDTVELLLAKGANLELKDKVGDTALIFSARNGRKSTANLLLSKGSDIEAKSEEGMSSLHWAAWNGHLETVELLLSKGANLEMKNKYGQTALICSARNGHKSTANFLLSKEKSKEGLSSLHLAAGKGHLETVELLLAKGANLELRDTYGRTPLICSARNGHKSAANILLSKGSDIEAKFEEGMSSLHWTAWKDHLTQLSYCWQNEKI